MSLLFSGSARVALHDSQFEIILIYITGYSTSLMSSAPFIFSQLSTDWLPLTSSSFEQRVF